MADDMPIKAKEAKEPLAHDVKRAPNRLIVDEAHGDGDNSVVMMSLAKMEGILVIPLRCHVFDCFIVLWLLSQFCHSCSWIKIPACPI